jgi:hypothetical protein
MYQYNVHVCEEWEREGLGAMETGRQGGDRSTDPPSSCQSGATPLFGAAGEGHGPVVEQLIAARCNVDLATTGDGQTPLFNAAMGGHAPVVEQLIAARCNVDLANTDDGQTPLYTASYHGHAPVVEQLIAARCNVDLARTDTKETPLSVAIRKGHTLVENMIRNPKAVEEARKKKLVEAEYWRSMEKEIGVLSLEEREALIKAVTKHAMRNDEGNAVKLGDDEYPGHKGSDKYYCGQNRAIPDSDGRCGPTAGPQCASCLRFQLAYTQNLPTNSSGTTKFGIQVRDLVIGKLAHAADGINLVLGLEDDANPELSIEGMEKELSALGRDEVSEAVHYVLYEVASEKEYPSFVRDRNNVGKTLDDFVQHPIAVKAKLNKADVAALRLYTTLVYTHINGPLRDNEGRPHPLPITVLLIIRALKKLRRVGADDLSGVSEMILWRGMKNVKTTEEFIREGGKCTSSPILTCCESEIA